MHFWKIVFFQQLYRSQERQHVPNETKQLKSLSANKATCKDGQLVGARICNCNENESIINGVIEWSILWLYFYPITVCFGFIDWASPFVVWFVGKFPWETNGICVGRFIQKAGWTKAGCEMLSLKGYIPLRNQLKEKIANWFRSFSFWLRHPHDLNFCFNKWRKMHLFWNSKYINYFLASNLLLMRERIWMKKSLRWCHFLSLHIPEIFLQLSFPFYWRCRVPSN